MRRWLGACLLVILLVAPPPTSAHEPGTGTIRVAVTDMWIAPLEGATARVHATGQENVTNVSGLAEIHDVPAGDHTLFAWKTGYFAEAQVVTVEADAVAYVGFVLEAIPPPPEPYVETFQFIGFIHCSVAAGPLQTEDKCNGPVSGVDLLVDPNARSKFEVAFDRGLSGAAVALSWEATNPSASRLALTWASPAGIDPAVLEGTSPLERSYGFGDESFTQSAGTARLDVRAASAPLTQPVVIEHQRFDVCLALAYNGAALPSDPCEDP